MSSCCVAHFKTAILRMSTVPGKTVLLRLDERTDALDPPRLDAHCRDVPHRVTVLSMPLNQRIRVILLELAATLESSVAGIFGAAALMAYLCQPYVPFLPEWTIAAGAVTGMSLAALITAAARKKPHHVVAQALSGAGGIVLLLVAFAQASQERAANDRRCLAVQRDMLSAVPRREDAPDLFQALGCRPQGDGSVFAKPRTSALPHQDRTGDTIGTDAIR